MSDLHDALEALADQWSRPNASTWASSVAFAHDLRQLLAAHPHPVAPAPTGLREALAEKREMVRECEATHREAARDDSPGGWNAGKVNAFLVVGAWLDDLLDAFPAPVLPEGAIPLDGWYVVPKDDPEWFAMYGPDDELCDDFEADELRRCGLSLPVPEPAPQITVGCIVRTPSGAEFSIEAIVRGKAWLFASNSVDWGASPLADLTFVAPSREAHGWPPIEEEAP